MTQIILPTGIEQQLSAADEAIELRGAGGKLLGVFVPALASEYANAQPDISDEELERRFAEGDGRTLPEIWADLRKQQQ